MYIIEQVENLHLVFYDLTLQIFLKIFWIESYLSSEIPNDDLDIDLWSIFSFDKQIVKHTPSPSLEQKEWFSKNVFCCQGANFKQIKLQK